MDRSGSMRVGTRTQAANEAAHHVVSWMSPLVPVSVEPVRMWVEPLSPAAVASSEAMMMEPDAVPEPPMPLTMEISPPVRLVESPARMRTKAPTLLPLVVPALITTSPACCRESPDRMLIAPVS